MKKRILLMLIAVVCLSPSVVFAIVGNDVGDGYFGRNPAFVNNGGVVTSIKSGPSSLGALTKPESGEQILCPIAAQRIRKSNDLQERVEGHDRTLSGNANGG